MVTIRIVEGVGNGPTPLAAFDAALADAGAERYNLIRLSSVIPAEATISRCDSLAELGGVGAALYAVRAEQVIEDDGSGAAGLAWARTDDGRGVFYEESTDGPDAITAVEDSLERDLEHGLALRDWDTHDRDSIVVETPPAFEGASCAVVLAAYGKPTTPW